MATKRKRVPEVLWRMFKKRARSLGETILATVGECRCKRLRCLSCSGDQAISLLLRPDDPSEYRKLLTECFAVVSENAPPLQPFDHHRRWPQLEIVRRTIEMMIYEHASSPNLLCDGYDKESRSSAIVGALTSSAWTLLLKRVGDAVMMYILNYTLLFLPLPRRKHHQVAGLPASDLCYKLSRDMSDSKTLHQPFQNHGSLKKKKFAEEVISIQGEQLNTGLWVAEPPSSFSSSRWHGFSCVSNEENLRKESNGSSNQDIISTQKHKRQHRWQRQRKRRHSAIQQTCSLNHISENGSNTEKSSRESQDDFTPDSGRDNETPELGFCCYLGFQNLQQLSGNAEIPRRNIFYRLENSMQMLPKKHILYTVNPNDSGALMLFKNIFGPLSLDENPPSITCSCSKSTLTRSSYLSQFFLKLLKSLIRKVQNCRHSRLLDKHCTILSSDGVGNGAFSMFEVQDNDSSTNLSISEHPDREQLPTSEHVVSRIEGKSICAASAENVKMVSETKSDQVEPSQSDCPKKQVVSFVWAICRRIVPSELLGEASNWRVLRRNISKFIQLRKCEKFSLKECLYRLKLLKYPILANMHCGCLQDEGRDYGLSDTTRHAILEHWIFWFFSNLVSPLLEANFYVTESEHGKQEVLYYLKSTWKEFMREAEKDQRYHRLNHANVRKILKNRTFGFSRARLCPKQIGFRVLANLRAPSKMRVNPPLRIHSDQHSRKRSPFYFQDVKYKFYKPVNSVLQDLHVVLKAWQKREPEKLGSSVFGYNDVYTKLVPFLLLLRNKSTAMPRVFIVVSDVSKAFDSVIQDKLLSVMKDVLLDDEYTLEKFIQVVQTKDSLKVRQHLTLADEDSIVKSGNIRSSLPPHSVEGVLVKKASSRIIKSDELDTILKEHIKRNIVKLRSSFYLQCVGIPQGSALSTLLCSYYYGCMERNIIFPFLDKACEDDNDGSSSASKYLLLRFVDDYLFMTTSKRQASMFFSRLERGVRDYNCCMNKEKYGLNFDMNDVRGCDSKRVYVGKDGVSFLRWSGLLVNSSTLEIQADYTRYLNFNLSSTLTVCRHGLVGRLLKEKLCRYLQPKCHPIFFDANINSASVVRLNIYQVFLLCAMKFICYISSLSTMPAFTPEFYINAILESLRYMRRLIKGRMYSLGATVDFIPKYNVKKMEIQWLGLYAYARVLKKKQSRHTELLGLVMGKLKAYGKLEDMSCEMKHAVDDAHSSVLWSIKY